MWNGKKVLVTGAGGFIGSHLTEALVRAGATTTAMVRYNSGSLIGNLAMAEADIRRDLRIVSGTIEDSDFVTRSVRGQDVVFHLAALIAIPYSYEAPRTYIRTNVEGTLNVLEAARQFGVARVVHTSTSEVYGTALRTPIDESHPLQGQSPYSASKIGADKLAESYWRSFATPVTTLRPFNTFGPRQSARAFIPTIISQAIKSDEIRLGSLTPERDMTFVSDTVAGFLAAGATPGVEGETINLGTGRTFSVEGHDNLIVGARKGSPLAVGYGKSEMYLGSDALALASLTDMISYLEDGDVTVIKSDGVEFLDGEGRRLSRAQGVIAADAGAVEKRAHRHYMHKEIHEQPEAFRRTLAQFVREPEGTVALPQAAGPALRDAGRVSITACGTAFLAGLVGRYWFERYADLPVDIDIASEFRYRDVPFRAGDLAVVVSQSGETADTLASLAFAKSRGQSILAVVNVPTSSMARASDIVLPTAAGPEIGVASTKAFTCQLATLACLAIAAGRERGTLSGEAEAALVRDLAEAPRLMASVLELEPAIRRIAQRIASSRSALFIGRGTSYPLALEGALKLKEVSYIHAEGYAAGELKHGPIALIDKDFPVVVIAPGDASFEKTMSNMQEVLARDGRPILITDRKGASLAPSGRWETLVLPTVPAICAPIVFALPLQLLAYHAALALGTDVDKPRNLAKSVTVE